MPYNGDQHTQAENDNHANQLNPNNDAYWESRGEEECPDDWEGLISEEETNDDDE